MEVPGSPGKGQGKARSPEEGGMGALGHGGALPPSSGPLAGFPPGPSLGPLEPPSDYLKMRPA